jgi:hypothetical protein
MLHQLPLVVASLKRTRFEVVLYASKILDIEGDLMLFLYKD